MSREGGRRPQEETPLPLPPAHAEAPSAPEAAGPAPVPAADPPRRGISHRLGVAIWLTVVVAAAVALVAAIAGTDGPGRVSSTWLGDAGAIAASTAYTWGLAARTGGRPLVFSLLTLVLGGLVVAVYSDCSSGGLTGANSSKRSHH